MSELAVVDTSGAAEGPDTPPAEDHVAAWKLFATLGVAGALAGTLLVFVFQATAPAIAAHKAAVLAEAVQTVLKQPHRYEPRYLRDGALTAQLAEGEDATKAERVFVGFDEAGAVTGVAVTADGPGFQDTIYLVYGYDPAQGQTLGLKVLGHKETPGLGDKIVKDTVFLAQWDGRATPLSLNSRGKRSEDSGIDGITGATISSRALVRIVNESLERWRAPLAGGVGGGGAP
jgi:electron transport complex protein RnfG